MSSSFAGVVRGCGRWLQGLTQAQTAFHQRRQLIQRDHVGAVAEGLVRPRVGLQEQPVAARRRRRSCQVRDHAPVAAAAVALAAWHLYAVSGVKDHGPAQVLHPRDRPHVADEHPVAERGAAFRQHQVPAADLVHFADDVFHVPGGHELALLDVDGPPRAPAASSRSVCRARNAGI